MHHPTTIAQLEHELAHNIIRITSLHQLTPCSHPGDDDTSVPSTSNVIRVEKESTNDVYVESTTINIKPNIMSGVKCFSVLAKISTLIYLRDRSKNTRVYKL